MEWHAQAYSFLACSNLFFLTDRLILNRFKFKIWWHQNMFILLLPNICWIGRNHASTGWGLSGKSPWIVRGDSHWAWSLAWLWGEKTVLVVLVEAKCGIVVKLLSIFQSFVGIVFDSSWLVKWNHTHAHTGDKVLSKLLLADFLGCALGIASANSCCGR